VKDEKCQVFINKILDAFLFHESQNFEVDNFDLLLLIQSITNVRNAGGYTFI